MLHVQHFSRNLLFNHYTCYVFYTTVGHFTEAREGNWLPLTTVPVVEKWKLRQKMQQVSAASVFMDVICDEID